MDRYKDGAKKTIWLAMENKLREIASDQQFWESKSNFFE